MFLMPTNHNLDQSNSLFHSMCIPFYSVLKMYIKMDRKHYYEKVRHGSEFNQEELDELFHFRIACYEKKSQYLIPKTTEEISREKIYDTNASHSIVRNRKGEMVASSRFLPYPFEMCTISDCHQIFVYLNLITI